MTLDELTELNALVARVRRLQADYAHSRAPLDYWPYNDLWKELRDGWGVELDKEVYHGPKLGNRLPDGDGPRAA